MRIICAPKTPACPGVATAYADHEYRCDERRIQAPIFSDPCHAALATAGVRTARHLAIGRGGRDTPYFGRDAGRAASLQCAAGPPLDRIASRPMGDPSRRAL